MPWRKRARPSKKPKRSRNKLYLRLYIAGKEVNSERAKSNLRLFCKELTVGARAIEIVDVFKNPRPALRDGVIVTPTLMVTGPGFQVAILGNLSDAKAVVRKVRVIE